MQQHLPAALSGLRCCQSCDLRQALLSLRQPLEGCFLAPKGAQRSAVWGTGMTQALQTAQGASLCEWGSPADSWGAGRAGLSCCPLTPAEAPQHPGLGGSPNCAGRRWPRSSCVLREVHFSQRWLAQGSGAAAGWCRPFHRDLPRLLAR